MIRPAWQIGLAAAALLAALDFAARERREAATERAAEHAIEVRRTDLEARFRAAQRDLQQAQRSRSDLQRAADAPGLSQLAAAAASPAAATQSRQGWFAAHPEIRGRYLKAYREGLGTSWGLLFHALNLSADQVEQLKDLLVRREDNDITVVAAANARGVPESDPAIQALDDRLSSENSAAIRALLGKPAYAEFRDFMHAQAVIPLVDELAGRVSSADEPLTADQALNLTRALADSSQKKPSGKVLEDTLNWDQAIVRAQAILSPSQLMTLSVMRQTTQARQQISQMYRAITTPAP